MISPDHTDAAAERSATPSSVRRSRTAVRAAIGVAAIALIALGSTACIPTKDAPKDAIAKYWGRNAACAEKIVRRESNFNPEARNPRSGTIGLFQLHPTHRAWVKRTFGYDWSELIDPYKNAEVAKGLSSEAYRSYRDGWQPWRMGGARRPGGGCPA